jgi:hypothetical protein
LRRLAIVISSVAWIGLAAAQAPVFMTLPTLTVPVFEGNEVSRQASLVLALELEPGRNEAEVVPFKPRLMDALLAELTQIFEQRATEERLIDAAALKPKLLETSRRVVGDGVVKDVLVQQAFERPRRR